MADQNKIAKTLSAEELARFCDRLSKTRGVTLQTIADTFERETGERVSLMGATSFRDTTFARFLQRIGKAAELREQLREATRAGNSTADAAALIISDEVLDKLVNRDADEELDLDVLSKIVKRLRDSDTSVSALRHRIDQDQNDAAKKVLRDRELLAAVAAIQRDDTLDESEKIARVRQKLFGTRPADFAPVTTTGAACTT